MFACAAHPTQAIQSTFNVRRLPPTTPPFGPQLAILYHPSTLPHPVSNRTTCSDKTHFAISSVSTNISLSSRFFTLLPVDLGRIDGSVGERETTTTASNSTRRFHQHPTSTAHLGRRLPLPVSTQQPIAAFCSGPLYHISPPCLGLPSRSGQDNHTARRQQFRRNNRIRSHGALARTRPTNRRKNRRGSRTDTSRPGRTGIQHNT
ncbi:hypothetical protein GE09DRAFT_355061 [Coniochaeta sp. 2T2.1]|nr:hypothetical protein GE09DRAFT_355061 [Coniochaeta sp. 2T2.1]